jgi:hypothetical protein
MSDDMTLAAWLCLFAALFFFIFWRAWRTYNLRGFVMYLLMWSCITSAVIFAVNSTTPSSAPRRQSIGIITWIVDNKQGRSHTYILGFRSDAGQDLTLEAAATPLFFAEKRDKVAITYLEEKRSYPRVIRFQALTGPRKGDETAVSADWFGPWLGVVFSAVIGIAAITGANRNKRLKKPTSSEQRPDQS